MRRNPTQAFSTLWLVTLPITIPLRLLIAFTAFVYLTSRIFWNDTTEWLRENSGSETTEEMVERIVKEMFAERENE